MNNSAELIKRITDILESLNISAETKDLAVLNISCQKEK